MEEESVTITVPASHLAAVKELLRKKLDDAHFELNTSTPGTQHEADAQRDFEDYQAMLKSFSGCV